MFGREAVVKLEGALVRKREPTRLPLLTFLLLVAKRKDRRLVQEFIGNGRPKSPIYGFLADEFNLVPPQG